MPDPNWYPGINHGAPPPPGHPAAGGGGAPPRPQGASGMFGGVYDAANDLLGGAPNTGNVQAGSQYAQNSLGSTNFAGSNDYLNALGNQASQADFNLPIQLLQQFLGANPNGSSNSSPGGSRGLGGRTFSVSSGGGGAPGGGSSGPGGVVPDTVGNSDSFFAQQIRALFDPSRLDPANDPTMAPYLDVLEQRAGERSAADQAALSAMAEGGGRFGSSLYNAQAGSQALGSERALNEAIAQTLFGSREAALGRQMQGLDMTNTRDLSAMNDMTQRAGIDAQSRASSAANAAQMAAARMAQETAFRGQDLGALQGIMGHTQFGLGQLGNVGQLLQQQQLGSLGAIPGLEAAALGSQGWDMNALNMMLGAAGGQGNLEGNRMAANASRAGTDFQRYMYDDQAAWRNINNMLGVAQTIGGMGGTSQGAPPYGAMTPPWIDPTMDGIGAWLSLQQGAGGSR